MLFARLGLVQFWRLKMDKETKKYPSQDSIMICNTMDVNRRQIGIKSGKWQIAKS